MPELRWILLAVGILLLAAIWWWESRRRRREADEEERVEGGEVESRSEPTLEEAAAATGERDADNLPPIRASRRERSRVAADLPVVEIPEDAEPELAQPSLEAEGEPVRVPYRSMQHRQALEDLPPDLGKPPPEGRAEAEQREPWVRTQPLDREKVMKGGEEPAQAPPGQDSAPESESPAGEPQGGVERQKIVALRLVAPHDRWPGASVRESLEAEGLRFGKYSIFHRERDDGRSIFYVANMIEPGSFDLDGMDSTEFPGISIFAVLPGPVDAGTTFDVMLATARRLAERLSGHLQDEQGSTLTAQRVLNLREELVHFEHLNRRLRPS